MFDCQSFIEEYGNIHLAKGDACVYGDNGDAEIGYTFFDGFFVGWTNLDVDSTIFKEFASKNFEKIDWEKFDKIYIEKFEAELFKLHEENIQPNDFAVEKERELTRQEMLALLSLMNAKLAERNQYGSVMMCGGAVMSLVYGARNATHDIDGLFEPRKDLLAIAKEIAAERNLNPHWFNDDFRIFNLADKFDVEIYKNFSNLQVEAVNAETMLALKIMAHRPYNQDLSDTKFLINFLKIDDFEQVEEILNRYKPALLHAKEVALCKQFARMAFQQSLEERH
jgi:hypothetical protein